MQLVGLVDMGTEETSMRAMQTGQDSAQVADQVLQFTFIGNDGFRFPFAHWPTTNTSPGVLYFAFWRAVKWLMKTGFEVFYACLDVGLNVNVGLNFFSMCSGRCLVFEGAVVLMHFLFPFAAQF